MLFTVLCECFLFSRISCKKEFHFNDNEVNISLKLWPNFHNCTKYIWGVCTFGRWSWNNCSNTQFPNGSATWEMISMSVRNQIGVDCHLNENHRGWWFGHVQRRDGGYSILNKCCWKQKSVYVTKNKAGNEILKLHITKFPLEISINLTWTRKDNSLNTHHFWALI